MNIGAPINVHQEHEENLRREVNTLLHGLRSNKNQSLRFNPTAGKPIALATTATPQAEKDAVRDHIRDTLTANHGEHVADMALRHNAVANNSLTPSTAKAIFEHVDVTKATIGNLKTTVGHIHDIAAEADAIHLITPPVHNTVGALLQDMHGADNHNLVDQVTRATTAIEIARNIAVTARTNIVTDANAEGHLLTRSDAANQSRIAQRAADTAEETKKQISKLNNRTEGLLQNTQNAIRQQKERAATAYNTARAAANIANIRLAEYTDSDRSSDSSGGSSHK